MVVCLNKNLSTENVEAVTKGFSNLQKPSKICVTSMCLYWWQLINLLLIPMQKIAELTRLCDEFGVPVELNECWENGGEGRH